MIRQETPTSINLDNLSVNENSPGTHIANISGVDPDGNELAYNIEVLVITKWFMSLIIY